MYIFIVSRPFLLRMRNLSDKRCTEYQNIHFGFINFFENHAVYEIMWKNIVERSRSHMTTWQMRIACWIPKATNTQTGCVILIVFPLQQWLLERASMLRYTYFPCLVGFFLGEFASLLAPSRLSACPHVSVWLPIDGFP